MPFICISHPSIVSELALSQQRVRCYWGKCIAAAPDEQNMVQNCNIGKHLLSAVFCEVFMLAVLCGSWVFIAWSDTLISHMCMHAQILFLNSYRVAAALGEQIR